MRKPGGHVPCPHDHPQTGRACQRPRHHGGPHQCCYPGGVDRWTGDEVRWPTYTGEEARKGERMAEFDDEPDDYDDDREDGDCHWCAGEGWSECSDPIECTREHRTYTSPAGVLYQECRCGSCGGSGRAEDMTIW